MLADRRSEALSTRFASQWLRLQDLEKMLPDYLLYPQYDDTLAQAMIRETELFFDSLVRDDRNVLDLLDGRLHVRQRATRASTTASRTSPATRSAACQVPGLPPRPARPGQHPDVSTSVADRTSPVLRGKWVMDVLLGTPPPPPPPNVPALDDSVKAERGRQDAVTTRQRMEEHRKNPTCNACHRFIDPLGLALENFDVDRRLAHQGQRGAGRRRSAISTTAPRSNGPAGLREALMRHQDMVLRSFTREPVDLCDRPPGRVLGHADGARDRPRRGEERQPDVVVRSRRRQQLGVPDGESRKHQRKARRPPTRCRDDGYTRRVTRCS